MIEFNFKTKVYYKDVDQMGVVYYTRYLEYFEAARTELLNSIGIRVTDIEKEGFYLPVITVHCNYKRSARFEDELIVKTFIDTIPKARLTINYTTLIDNKIIGKGYTIHGFTTLNGKPARPPKSFLMKLYPYFC